MRWVFKLVFCLFFPIWVGAWNAAGHKLVAQIAYDQLTPAVQKKIDAQIKILGTVYPGYGDFIDAAYWPDAIKKQGVTAFSNWHWIGLPYSFDGTRGYKPNYANNVVWAIGQAQQVLQSPNANAFTQAMFLAFLSHFVGDIHQPLHCLNLYSKGYPHSDQGGHYYLINTPRANNLHTFWDQGLGVFNSNTAALAKKIEAQYPPEYFAAQLKDSNPKDWAQESYQIARDFAYTTRENKTPNAAYIAQGQQIAKQRVALAGYRLAQILNQLEN